MGRYDYDIDRHFKTKTDRAMMRAEVAKYEGKPGMDAQIPGMIRMLAELNDAVGAGTMEPAEAHEIIISTVETTMPPQVASEITARLDEAMEAGVEILEDDRKAVEAEAKAAADKPADADPDEKPTDKPADQADKQPPKPAPAPVKANKPFAGPDRAALEAQNAEHLKNMRAPENSPEWFQYWKQGGAAQYRANLEAIEAMDAPPPAPAPADAAPGAAAGAA
jgi:hypothetical protein